MRAAGFMAYGSPKVLQSIEVQTPQAGPGEVRVRVKAAGVQPFDCAVRSGWTPPGATVQFPQIVGNEFAGTIDQLGDGVTDFTIGQEVLGYRMLGCNAEYVIVGREQIVPKPKSMPWEVAASLSASGQTAHTAMEELRVGKGDTVLIHGAAGGVGTVTVQVAKSLGATVIGTASEANHDYLRTLGAIPVLYGEGLRERILQLAPEGVDVALDAAGDEALRVSMEVAKSKERIGTIVAFELAASLGIRSIRSKRSASRLQELVNLYVAGQLQLHVRKTYPLERAAEAHEEMERGHGRGKIVIVID